MLTRDTLTILNTGVLTSLQDLGRVGYMSFGVSRSGAMDQYSARLANWLVGNDENAALLETMLSGLYIKFHSNCQIAITGGDLGARINERSVERYRMLNVNVGDELKFTKRRTGLLAYLSVSGGFDLDAVMGSKSTNMIVDLGIKKIKNGDQLHFNNHHQLIKEKSIPAGLVPVYSSHFTARVTRGPEFNLFDDQFKELLSAQAFGISSASNRMGYRLGGLIADTNLPKGIISGGVIPGTIQIPSSGEPIILMNDGPTTGGYPRIANVITQDLDMIAQLAPGDTLRLQWIPFEEAERLRRDWLEDRREFLAKN